MTLWVFGYQYQLRTSVHLSSKYFSVPLSEVYSYLSKWKDCKNHYYACVLGSRRPSLSFKQCGLYQKLAYDQKLSEELQLFIETLTLRVPITFDLF